MRKPTKIKGHWYVRKTFVQAIQVDLNNAEELFSFCKSRLRYSKDRKQLLLRTTKEGVVKVKPGNYIVRTPNGSYYKIGKVSFENHFVETTEEQ